MKDRLKKLRKTLGLTQQEFADRIGINRGNVATYETREGNPGASVITLICREFNVNETWLRTGEGEMFNKTLDSIVDQLATEFGLDGFLQSVVSEYLKLDKKQRNTVQNFIFNIVSEIPSDLIPAPAEQAADQEAPARKTVPRGYSSMEELEREVEQEVEQYRQQRLSEKLRELQASSANGSGEG